MNSVYVSELAAYLQPFANPEAAAKMKAYMREQFPFLGIRKPQFQTLMKAWIKEQDMPAADELPAIIRELWQMPEREYQYAALHLLHKQARRFPREAIDLLEELALARSWWDTVDELAPNLMGVYFLQYPDTAAPYTERWIGSGEMWLQRCALLFQLKYREKTDWERLTRYILQCAEPQPFFIRKASGWALRQYARTHPEAVRQFVRAYQDRLAPLTVREALKRVGDSPSDASGE